MGFARLAINSDDDRAMALKTQRHNAGQSGIGQPKPDALSGANVEIIRFGTIDGVTIFNPKLDKLNEEKKNFEELDALLKVYIAEILL